jgi:NRAMP (natural resistance-associated macrophage protein)-like metal ion transporter
MMIHLEWRLILRRGAQYGFSMLWSAIFTFPFMAIVQEMCARIGIVRGEGLAATIRKYTPKYVLYIATICLLVANTFNIGADISAVGETVRLVFPQLSPLSIMISFVLISLMLQIFVSYKKYAGYLKYLSFILIVYIIAGFSLNLNWSEIFSGTFMPRFSLNKDSILLICAIFGTSITPYCFFWQTSQEVEEKLALHDNKKYTRQEISHEENQKAISDMRFDVWSGMFFSNLTMFFIITVCGVVLYPNGINNIETAAQAASALLPFAGQATYVLFTLGIVGTGFLAVPVLAGSSAYVMAETFRFKEGLYNKYHEAKAFYFVIIISLVFGLLITFSGISPMKALFYSAVLNGMISPLLLILIVYLASSHKIMGKYKNSKPQIFLGVVITFVMSLASIASIWFLISV